jgi:hypothetical protein
VKLTVSDCPTEKLFQLTTARLELWVMFSVVGLVCRMVAEPDTTAPPWGNMFCARLGAATENTSTTVTSARALAGRQWSLKYCRSMVLIVIQPFGCPNNAF